MKSNKPNFGKTDLQTVEIVNYPDVSEQIQQTLARLMGFDSANGLYRQLLADSDGRLLVSTSATQGTTAVNSQTTVGIASSQLVAANNSRKSVYIQNLGAAPIYLGYGVAGVVATGFQIPAGGVFIEDRYQGAINAISGSAGNDVRLLEI